MVMNPAMKVLTHLELSKLYAGDLPEWQHEANARFFESVWNALQMGGIYGWPREARAFRKVEGGWEEIP